MIQDEVVLTEIRNEPAAGTIGVRWPTTANPHLLIHANNANHLGPVQADWLTRRLGLSTQALREDRILHEVQAGGDIRRIYDLFGLSTLYSLGIEACRDRNTTPLPPWPPP